MSDIIHLNVGGTLYTTTKETLTKDQWSYLHNLFKDFPKVPSWYPKDKDGNYFIDADGPLFRYILNYLRSLSVTSDIINLPSDFQEHEQLEEELKCYGISPTIEAIHQNKKGKRSKNTSSRRTLQEAWSKYNVQTEPYNLLA